jgi:hypothetical protein
MALLGRTPAGQGDRARRAECRVSWPARGRGAPLGSSAGPGPGGRTAHVGRMTGRGGGRPDQRSARRIEHSEVGGWLHVSLSGPRSAALPRPLSTAARTVTRRPGLQQGRGESARGRPDGNMPPILGQRAPHDGAITLTEMRRLYDRSFATTSRRGAPPWSPGGSGGRRALQVLSARRRARAVPPVSRRLVSTSAQFLGPRALDDLVVVQQDGGLVGPVVGTRRQGQHRSLALPPQRRQAAVESRPSGARRVQGHSSKQCPVLRCQNKQHLVGSHHGAQADGQRRNRG